MEIISTSGMVGNSTSLFGDFSNSTLIQGLESGIEQMSGLSSGTADIISALFIIICAIILAKVLKFIVVNVAPHLVSKTETTLDDEIIKAVNGPLQVFIVAIGIYMAVAALNHLPGDVSGSMGPALTVVLIYIAAYLVANLASGLINWYKNDIAPHTESDLDDVLMPFLGKSIGVTVFILATLMAISSLGIEITPLIATMGVGGIAVALAAQELLSNVFGAISILSDRPYKVGDRIAMTDGLLGDVVEIGLRSTRVKTLDGRITVIPNSDISKSMVTNYSQPDPKLRYNIKVGISYGADVGKASRILLEVAGSTSGVLKEPAPEVFITDLGTFSVNLLMQVWLEDYRMTWDVPDRIYRETLKRFAAEKIEIPYPTTSIIVDRPGITVEAFKPTQKR
ncbi:MAG TPA: mechanosensitive ion channel family protein [Methanocellaceae archaeon]